MAGGEGAEEDKDLTGVPIQGNLGHAVAMDIHGDEATVQREGQIPHRDRLGHALQEGVGVDDDTTVVGRIGHIPPGGIGNRERGIGLDQGGLSRSGGIECDLPAVGIPRQQVGAVLARDGSPREGEVHRHRSVGRADKEGGRHQPAACKAGGGVDGHSGIVLVGDLHGGGIGIVDGVDALTGQSRDGAGADHLHALTSHPHREGMAGEIHQTEVTVG